VPAPDWSRFVLDAHEEGYAAVGPAVDAEARADRRIFAAWAPGGGRTPRRPPTPPTPPPARACRRSTAPTPSSKGGPWSDFGRDPVVRAAEDERAEAERDTRRADGGDGVGGIRGL